MDKKLSAHRLAGPFSDPPFETFPVSPLGVVPKKIPGEYSLIHHLYSPKGASVNDGISSEDSSVQYATIQDAITIVKSVGKDCFLAKTDIKNVTSKGYPCSLIKTTDVTWIESERNSNARIMPKSKFIKSSRRKYNQRMTTLQLA